VLFLGLHRLWKHEGRPQREHEGGGGKRDEVERYFGLINLRTVIQRETGDVSLSCLRDLAGEKEAWINIARRNAIRSGTHFLREAEAGGIRGSGGE